MPYVMPSAGKKKRPAIMERSSVNLPAWILLLLGRITGAALSSTPLTNLWLSSAPNDFASSIASLMATLYGTSLRLDSSYSAMRSTASTCPSSSSRPGQV